MLIVLFSAYKTRHIRSDRPLIPRNRGRHSKVWQGHVWPERRLSINNAMSNYFWYLNLLHRVALWQEKKIKYYRLNIIIQS